MSELEKWEQETGEIFAHNLTSLGLPCDYVRCVNSPLGNTFLFNLKYIGDYDKSKIEKKIEQISIFQQHKLSFVERPNGAHFGVFWYDREQKLDLGDLLVKNGLLKWILGQDLHGDIVELDLRKIPHLLIGGTTGAGKSVLIHNIIFNILNYYSTKGHVGKAEMIIIDCKGNELNEYKGCKNVNFISSVEQAIDTLEKCAVAMDKLYEQNIKSDEQHFIIIDELADLMLRSKFRVEEAIVRLAQKGRACGIHLVVATQRPTTDVCSGLIKANMPDRIVLRTASTRDSVVMLDHKGAESLEGQGDCILRLNGKERRCLIAMPSDQDKEYMIGICG